MGYHPVRRSTFGPAQSQRDMANCPRSVAIGQEPRQMVSPSFGFQQLVGGKPQQQSAPQHLWSDPVDSGGPADIHVAPGQQADQIIIGQPSIGGGLQGFPPAFGQDQVPERRLRLLGPAAVGQSLPAIGGE